MTRVDCLAALTAVLLAGCGAGAGASPAPAPAPVVSSAPSAPIPVVASSPSAQTSSGAPAAPSAASSAPAPALAPAAPTQASTPVSPAFEGLAQAGSTAGAASSPPAAAGEKKPTTWGNQADKQADAAGVRMLTNIPSRDDKLVFAPYPSPFVLIGQSVYDIAEDRETGKVEALSKKTLARFALSPDGKRLAQVIEDPAKKYVNVIEIVDTATGKPQTTIRYTEEQFKDVSFMTFTRFNHLAAMVSTKDGDRACLWRVEDGKPLAQVAVEKGQDYRIAFSDNGQYMAGVSDSRLRVFDMTKGKAVAEMQSPPDEWGIASFTIFITSLAFSPDGTELAALITGKDASLHLIVWGADGKIVFHNDMGLAAGAGYNEGPPLIWAPDGQGWLIHGDFFFDRTFEGIAWILQPPVQHGYPHRFLDDNHLLTSRGDFTERQLVSIEIPRAKIAAAAQALKSGEAALLKPGDTIGLVIEVGALRFSDPNTVRNELASAIAKRLSAGGLKVAASGDVTLVMRYAELQGGQLNVVEGGLGITGRATGQTVQETVGQLEAVMTRDGKTIWKTRVQKGNPHFVNSATVDNAKVRDAMFSGIRYMLSSMTVPHYIPAGEDATGLPITATTAR